VLLINSIYLDFFSTQSNSLFLLTEFLIHSCLMLSLIWLDLCLHFYICLIYFLFCCSFFVACYIVNRYFLVYHFNFSVYYISRVIFWVVVLGLKIFIILLTIYFSLTLNCSNMYKLKYTSMSPSFVLLLSYMLCQYIINPTIQCFN